ncbi:zinc ribbon domain-containing protein [Halobacteriaceae archaeon GCM10025711]
MGLFRDVGRRIESFKQQASEAARDEASHECGDCGEPLYAAPEACPHCGSDDVVAREAADAE